MQRLLAWPALVTTLSLSAACDSNVDTPVTAGQGGGPVDCSAVTFDGSGRQPPDGPTTPLAPDGPSTVLTIERIDLGTAEGWKTLGYNLDDAVTDIETASDAPCTPAGSGSEGLKHRDGQSGIDNAFGQHIVPLLEGAVENFIGLVDSGIERGGGTILIALESVGSGSTYSPVMTRLYRAADLGSSPEFDGKDAWPVRGDSLEDAGDINSAKHTLGCSYITDDIWVSGRLDQLSMALPYDAAAGSLPLEMHNVVITMELGEKRKTAKEGRIAGAIRVEDLVDALLPIVAPEFESVCTEDGYDNFVDSVRQVADIRLANGQGACDAVSIGLGFEAASVKLGTVGLVGGSPADPCEDTDEP